MDGDDTPDGASGIEMLSLLKLPTTLQWTHPPIHLLLRLLPRCPQKGPSPYIHPRIATPAVAKQDAVGFSGEPEARKAAVTSQARLPYVMTSMILSNYRHTKNVIGFGVSEMTLGWVWSEVSYPPECRGTSGYTKRFSALMNSFALEGVIQLEKLGS